MADTKPGEVGTIIGADATFKGEMSFESGLRLEGKFEGQLKSKGKLTVGKNAQLTGETTVGSASIEGQLKGNVTGSDRVELTSSAQVLGDIRSPRLIIAEGATLVGNVNVSPDALKGGAPQSAAVPKTTEAPVQKK
jgi:cytoskeletal protein CcmA (bactofilin family)